MSFGMAVARRPSVLPARRLLLVDDEADVRELMTSVLESNGYEVIAVESGAEALAFLARDTPCLMLLDLEMDDMNGWEVLSAIEPRRVPTVVVTGSSASVPKWVGHLRKPFRIDALLELLKHLPQ
jgi:CheY-like chemotaxis protein